MEGFTEEYKILETEMAKYLNVNIAIQNMMPMLMLHII